MRTRESSRVDAGRLRVNDGAAPTLLLIGRGSIGRKHERNAQELGLEVITVDPDPGQEADFERLQDVFSEFGSAGLPYALIATPPAHHVSTFMELLEHGISSILLEKPLCLPKELDQLVSLSSRLTGQQVFLGFNWRFNSQIQQMKHRIQRGDIGCVQVAHLSAREWLPRYKGNVVLESGSHILDTARYLLGELTVVGAHISNHHKVGEFDESASFLLRTREHAHVSVHVNFINPGPYDYTILVQGESGVLQCQPDRTEPMHRMLLEAFLHQDTTVLATMEDGIRNMELLNGIVEYDTRALVTSAPGSEGEESRLCCS